MTLNRIFVEESVSWSCFCVSLETVQWLHNDSDNNKNSQNAVLANRHHMRAMQVSSLQTGFVEASQMLHEDSLL